MSDQRYSIETLGNPNWIYVLDHETGDCIAYYEWREGATAGRPGSRQWARECAERAMADRIREDTRAVIAIGLRRIGIALVIWSAMARLWAGRCNPCGGSGVDWCEFGACECGSCEGRGWRA